MKNKIIFLIAMLAATAMNTAAQSSQDVILSERRTSMPYHFISIKGEMNVKLVQDETAELRVDGTSYQLDNTITMLRNDTLFVYQTNIQKGEGKTRLSINVNDISLLEVSGKTKVDCSGLVNTDYLTIRAKDGAQIKLDVRALKVQSEVTGCGIISLTGNAASNVESIEGCGSIDSHLLDVMEHKNDSRYTCSGC
jgi:hypothetical protein